MRCHVLLVLCQLLTASCWSLGGMSSRPVRRAVANACGVAAAFMPLAGAWSLDNTVTNEKGAFSFKYTDDLKVSPKPLQTHNIEVYLKSEKTKGFNVGLTVSRNLVRSQ
jgi:hypothetical protein